MDLCRDGSDGDASGSCSRRVEEVDDLGEQEWAEDDEQRVDAGGEECQTRNDDIGQDEQYDALPVEHVG